MADSIDLKSLRVVDLRKELEKRNLSKTGKKEELLARLEQALLEEKEENKSNDTKEEKEEEEEEKAKEEDKSVQETTDNTTEKELQPENNTHEQQTPMESIPQPVEKEKTESVSDNDATKEEAQEQQSTFENKEKEMDTSDVDNTTSKEDKMEEDQGNKRKREEENTTDTDKRAKTDDDSKSIKDNELTKDNESSKITTTNSHENEEQTAICIKNLLRPLVARDVRDLVGKYGEVKRLFIDHVKTHCYANYETVKEADDALKNIDGIQFPPETGKIVSVIKLYPSQVEKLIKREQELENQGMIRPPWEKFLNNVLNNVDIDEGINDDSNNSNTNSNNNDSTNNSRKRISALEQITKQLNQRSAISIIGQAKDRKSKSILERLSTSSASLASETTTTKMPVGKSLDELFLKTKANPPLYYLPVDDTIAKERLSSLKKEKI